MGHIHYWLDVHTYNTDRSQYTYNTILDTILASWLAISVDEVCGGDALVSYCLIVGKIKLGRLRFQSSYTF